MKRLLKRIGTSQQHWVGDGFPVRTIFSYNEFGRELSPFLLMDYAGPAHFDPTESKRGVGEHPHRGFETVTIVYDGEVEHRDSAGGGGLIRAGDVQWMTAASGLVHEEMHGPEFAKRGGRFEMIQLWVNLSATNKRAKPRYQSLASVDIPTVELPNDAGIARIIAGELAGTRGPAQTYSPINLWDIRLHGKATLTVPDGHTASVFVLEGAEIETGNGEHLQPGELALFEPSGASISLISRGNSKLLFLGGEPLNEPIVGYGPFVMNTVPEIQQAILDFNAGRMGRL